MLSSLAHLQGNNNSNACKKIHSIEAKVNEKMDNLEEKFVGLRSTIRTLDQRLASRPTFQEECDATDLSGHQVETCLTVREQEPQLDFSDETRAVDLRLKEDIVYADSDEEEDFRVIEGGLGFGIIVDAKPEVRIGKTAPLQKPAVSPESRAIASIDEGRDEPSMINQKGAHHEQVTDRPDCHSDRTHSKRTAQPTEPADPGKFTITCSIGDQQLNGCILDLGSSNSIMPLKIAESLGTPEMRETTAPLILGDGSLCYPTGIIENIPVRFKGHILCTTFVVTDSKNKLVDNIILGRPFLSAARAEIFVAKERVDFYLGQKKEKHQVWMKGKAKPAREKNVIRLSECNFMQEISEPEKPARPERPSMPQKRKHIRKRRTKPLLGEDTPKPVMEWRVKEPHDPGGWNPKRHRGKEPTPDVRDPSPHW